MSNIISILRLARPLYHLMAWMALLVLLGAVFSLVAPILSKFIVDEIVAEINTGEGSLSQLFWLIGLSFAVQFLGIVVTSVSERLGDHFSGRLHQYLTEEYYDKVLILKQKYFDGELSGKIVHQLNRGINSIQNFIRSSTNFILPTFVQSIFTIAVLFYYNWVVGLLVFSLFPIYYTLSHFSAKRWGKYENEKNALEDVTRGRIQEVVSNIKLVKTYTNERKEWNFISKKLTDINKIYAVQSQGFHVYDFVRNLSLILVLLGVSIVVFRNTFLGLMTIGEMVLILQLVEQARRPLFAMSFILTQIQTAESGSKAFFEVMQITEVEDLSKKRLVVKPPIEVVFKDVSFKYEDSENVLRNISLKLRSPEKIALVGHSGAGKSTIVNLLLKLYEPTEGQIKLNGHFYAKLNAEQVREQMSLVMQENELFSTTIRENVSYGTKAGEEDLIRALKQAQAWEFVSKLPKGMDSEIGERGVRLSGGQRQRIQIARAILHDKPILVLDEATSSLDSRSEYLVQQALEKLMEDRLTIIIAHRLSTIQHVDRILVIDEGKIVSEGSPKKLAKEPGIYHDLLKYQMEGNKEMLAEYEMS